MFIQDGKVKCDGIKFSDTPYLTHVSSTINGLDTTVVVVVDINGDVWICGLSGLFQKIEHLKNIRYAFLGNSSHLGFITYDDNPGIALLDPEFRVIVSNIFYDIGNIVGTCYDYIWNSAGEIYSIGCECQYEKIDRNFQSTFVSSRSYSLDSDGYVRDISGNVIYADEIVQLMSGRLALLPNGSILHDDLGTIICSVENTEEVLFMGLGVRKSLPHVVILYRNGNLVYYSCPSGNRILTIPNVECMNGQIREKVRNSKSARK